jgi:hypothetical protein
MPNVPLTCFLPAIASFAKVELIVNRFVIIEVRMLWLVIGGRSKSMFIDVGVTLTMPDTHIAWPPIDVWTLALRKACRYFESIPMVLRAIGEAMALVANAAIETRRMEGIMVRLQQNSLE